MNFLLFVSLTGFLSFTFATSTSEPYSTPTTDDYHPTFPTPPPTGTGCPTITYSTGSACSLPTPCIRPLCLILATITVPCGCMRAVASTTQCETKCDGACGTAYSTLYAPCPTGPSHTDECSDSRTHSYDHHTTIKTLTTCPHSMSCHGQTTTWTGTVGPSSCQGTCTCVLPTQTGGTQTDSVPTPTGTGTGSGSGTGSATGTGKQSNTSPTPTPTPTPTGSSSGTLGSQTGTGTVTSGKPTTTTSAASTLSQANAGGKVSGGHGSLVWFLVGVLGLL
jgi:hypothetical protein